MIQVVDFNTWSRIINGNRKESMLDHVYLNNFEIFDSVYFENSIFGDHVLVILKLVTKKAPHINCSALKRNWSNYSVSLLNSTLLPMIVTVHDTLYHMRPITYSRTYYTNLHSPKNVGVLPYYHINRRPKQDSNHRLQSPSLLEFEMTPLQTKPPRLVHV